MPSPDSSPVPDASDRNSSERLTNPPANEFRGPRTPEEFDRWAGLIADGEISFPRGLNSVDEARLLCEVGRQRRARLVKYIARAIALDIHGARQAGQKD